MARLTISSLPTVTSVNQTDVLLLNRNNTTHKQQVGTIIKSYNFGKFFSTFLDIPFNHDLETRQMVGSVSCSRNSVATTFNHKTGELTKYTANTPRYQIMNNGSNGILRESQKLNFIPNSNVFTPTVVNATSTVTNGNQTGPDNVVNSADTLTFLGGTVSFDMAMDVTPLSNLSNMSLSFFIKAGTATNFVCTVIDTSNNSIIVEREFISSDFDTAKYSRLQLNFVSPASNSLRIVFGNYVVAGTLTQTNGSIFLYGLQLENAQYMTSYIENTTGAPATRNFDNISMPFDNNFLLTHEWTMLFDVDLPIQDSTNSNSFIDFIGVSGMGFLKSSVYSTQQFKNGGVIETNIVPDGSSYRIKLRNTRTDCSLWVNDVKVSSSNNLSMVYFNKLVNCTGLSIGGYEGINDASFTMSSLKMFNNIFTDDEMVFL